MAVEIVVPQLGESVYEGVIARWFVEEGGHIKRDEPLLEIETDKITMEIPSPGEGIVAKQLVKAGETVEVGQLIGYILAEGEKLPESIAEKVSSEGEVRSRAKPESEEKERVIVSKESKEEKAGQPASSASVSIEQPAHHEKRRTLRLSPAVSRLISEYDLDPLKIKGTGIGGRIRKVDIEAIISDPLKLAQARRGETSGAPPSAKTAVEPVAQKVAFTPAPVLGEAKEVEERKPLTTIRRTIIKALTKSYSTAVHTLTVDEADCTNLVAFVEKYRNEVYEKYGVKLTYTAFFIKSVIQPLKDFPLVNAELDEEKEEIVLKKYYHIGFATNTDAGLVVPKIDHADRKSLIHIAAELAEKAERARQRKLSLDELHGSTFTITNAGSFGALMSAPIINYPNTAILGIHAIQKRPVVIDGEIVARDMVYLSLSFDHRVIDGVYAVKFLRAVCEQVENPDRMLLTT